jgi:hypothetical protein
MHPEFWFVIYVFAVYRLAELVSHDLIFDTVRRRIATRAAAGTRMWKAIADWMHCPLCIGVWVSVPAAFLYVYAVLGYADVLTIIVVWLGMAGMQYLISSFTLVQDSI